MKKNNKIDLSFIEKEFHKDAYFLLRITAILILFIHPLFHFILSYIPDIPADSLLNRSIAVGIAMFILLIAQTKKPHWKIVCLLQTISVSAVFISTNKLIVDSGSNHYYIAAGLICVFSFQLAFIQIVDISIAFATSIISYAFFVLHLPNPNLNDWIGFAIHFNCYLISFLLAIQKIRSRKNELFARQALQYSKNRYRGLSNASFEGIIISDEGLIIEANKNIYQLFKYGSDELTGNKDVDIIITKDQESVANKLMTGFDKPFETFGLKKDGASFPIEVQIKMFSYENRPVKVMAIRDLTEKKRAEEEISILRGILPICAKCKKIRDDEGYWNQIEGYIQKHSDAVFSHGICHECSEELYGKDDWYIEMKKKEQSK